MNMQVSDLYTVAVGIGRRVNTAVLRDIAGKKGTVISIESFEQLASELSAIKDKVCGKL